jgi:hypothetical protein
VVLALGGVPSVAAAPPTSASGTFTVTSLTFNSTRDAGGNTIVHATFTESWTGTFTGTTVGTSIIILHADGSGLSPATQTFTGSVNGASGTLTFSGVLLGTASGSLRGPQTILSGTGELANLHGVLNQVGTLGDTGPVGTYTGQIHFDP